jgi:ATP:corrinoid adenosyltransferase
MGNDLNVAMVQFMKCPQYYGNTRYPRIYHVHLLPMGRDVLSTPTSAPEDREAAAAALRKSEELMHSASTIW